jgi:hypothetical protein
MKKMILRTALILLASGLGLVCAQRAHAGPPVIWKPSCSSGIFNLAANACLSSGGLSSTLSSANVFVGNASNVATGVAITGDVAITNAGVTTVGTSANTASAVAKRDSNGLIQAQIQPAINAQTGTTYTLVAADNGKIVTLSNASAITLTIPTGLGAGFNCMIVQLGAGVVTLTASSTTINNRQSFTKTAGQYATVSLFAYAANTFVSAGDMQ